MSGGGGSVGYRRSEISQMRRAISDTLASEERAAFEAETNAALQDLLASFNAIDRDQIRERLETVAEALGEEVEFDKFLYAGSVAKHTAVDGLSDVDALMVFSPESVQDVTPEAIRQKCKDILLDDLDKRDVQEVRTGTMAVTVVYKDGQELQVLPAVRRSDTTVEVPNVSGSGWVSTQPLAFRQKISAANDQMGNKLVPCIKLFKSIIANLPAQRQISGYHAEALAVDAATRFRADAPKSLRSVLLHLVNDASQRVLRPLADVTGQSSAIDQSLGAASSPERRLVADALSQVHRRLESTRDLKDWRKTIGGEQ